MDKRIISFCFFQNVFSAIALEDGKITADFLDASSAGKDGLKEFIIKCRKEAKNKTVLVASNKKEVRLASDFYKIFNPKEAAKIETVEDKDDEIKNDRENFLKKNNLKIPERYFKSDKSLLISVQNAIIYQFLKSQKIIR